MKKITAVLILAVIILATGCQMVYDLWPADTPKVARDYVPDFNKPGFPPWDCIDRAEKTRQAVISKHLEQQIDLKYFMEKDTARYDLAINQVNINLQQAKLERDSTVGTIANPGWLLGLALTATGAGAYFAGYKTQRPEDYNEFEYQQAIALAKAKSETKNS